MRIKHETTLFFSLEDYEAIDNVIRAMLPYDEHPMCPTPFEEWDGWLAAREALRHWAKYNVVHDSGLQKDFNKVSNLMRDFAKANVYWESFPSWESCLSYVLQLVVEWRFTFSKWEEEETE